MLSHGSLFSRELKQFDCKSCIYLLSIPTAFLTVSTGSADSVLVTTRHETQSIDPNRVGFPCEGL